EEREHERSAMLADIDNWQDQCLGKREQGPLPAEVYRALKATAQRSDLGETPWTGLADAMRRDVYEQPMPDWDDFLGYAAGATVAPATIFIYLLGAKPAERGFAWDLPELPVHYAADLGIFCYLVHILRDLAKDAERSERLVTIPDSLIEDAELQKIGLSDAIRARDPRVGSLAADLRERASFHLNAGRDCLQPLRPLIGRREQLALSGLIGIYESLFDRFSADYFAGMADAPALEQALRKKLLASQVPS
ncbi:MAG: squalene/phytoene synthase family protein, partial [Nisaea sp.]